MDIAKFESLLYLPLMIKQVKEWGSWRGIYAEPAMFFMEDSKYIPISELKKPLNALTSGKLYDGYKGGEFSFSNSNEIHFEYAYNLCEDLSILNLLSPESIEYLQENKIELD